MKIVAKGITNVFVEMTQSEWYDLVAAQCEGATAKYEVGETLNVTRICELVNALKTMGRQRNPLQSMIKEMEDGLGVIRSIMGGLEVK